MTRSDQVMEWRRRARSKCPRTRSKSIGLIMRAGKSSRTASHLSRLVPDRQLRRSLPASGALIFAAKMPPALGFRCPGGPLKLIVRVGVRNPTSILKA